MKDFKHLNEQQAVGDNIYAKELLTIDTWYNQEQERLNNMLAKKREQALVNYQKRAQSQAALQAAKTTAAKVAGTQAPTTTQQQTGTVNTAGQPVNADGSPVTRESYSNILKIKEIINEEKFDATGASSDEYEDLKNYLDAENLSYVEDEDQTSIDFESDELDPEWENRLDDMGLEPVDNVATDDILDVEDEEDWEQEEREQERTETNAENDEDFTDEQEKIDQDKVFYVKITDAEGDFTGKIYKLFDDGEWRAKVVDGDSKTFEKLNYEPSFDDIDIIAFLRENYDDAELIDEQEFNGHVEEPTVEPEVKESHKIETFEDFLNETR